MNDTDTDKTYSDATSDTLGRAMGAMFQGLLTTMTREEALEVVKTYVYGLAIKPSEVDE